MDRAMLMRILKIQSVSGETGNMTRQITEECLRLGANVVIDEGNVYAVKGKAEVYPCIVAHTDTVHEIINSRRYKVKQKDGRIYGWDRWMHRPTGVGGDDKCGIAIALHCLKELPACKVAFFRDEEIGTVGAKLAKMEFFDDCAFVLQADRKGHDDFVSNAGGVELFDEEFQTATRGLLHEFDFQLYTWGSLTDVMTLKEKGLDVVAVNISAGYYNPHREDEYIVVRDLLRSAALMLRLCEELGYKRWLHKSAPRFSSYNYQSYYTPYNYTSKSSWDKESQAEKDRRQQTIDFYNKQLEEQDAEYEELNRKYKQQQWDQDVLDIPPYPTNDTKAIALASTLCPTCMAVTEFDPDEGWYCWVCDEYVILLEDRPVRPVG
jgi:tripeptide aminopeptidase